jgi:hypothetical protein
LEVLSFVHWLAGVGEAADFWVGAQCRVQQGRAATVSTGHEYKVIVWNFEHVASPGMHGPAAVFP